MQQTNEMFQGETARFLIALAILIAAIGVVVVIYRFITKKLTQRASRTANKIDDVVVDVLKMPFLFLLIWIMLFIFTRTSFFVKSLASTVDHILEVLFIITVGWIMIKLTRVLFVYLERKLEVKKEANNYQTRSSLTKLSIFERMISGLIVVLIVALCLMTFDSIRAVGVSLLTSAGIAGIIVGFAAQKSLGMVMGGIQIAITQPIKLDDQVIVDGQSGRIEEIKLTYVVVKLWDEKRLILPVTYFLEQPFQNWTRSSSDITGTVFLYVDYNMPVDELRKELQSILSKSDNWDGRFENIQVTNTTENYMELRVLLSGADSGKIWNLQVEVREKLVKFIQQYYPESLVKTRVKETTVQQEETGNESGGGEQ